MLGMHTESQNRKEEIADDIKEHRQEKQQSKKFCRKDWRRWQWQRRWDAWGRQDNFVGQEIRNDIETFPVFGTAIITEMTKVIIFLLQASTIPKSRAGTRDYIHNPYYEPSETETFYSRRDGLSRTHTSVWRTTKVLPPGGSLIGTEGWSCDQRNKWHISN